MILATPISRIAAAEFSRGREPTDVAKRNPEPQSGGTGLEL